jgi:hypothetical protein
VKPARIASFPSLPQDGFPFWIFNPTNTASVHYRVATIAQYLLCKKNISIKRTQQTTDDYVYASLFSREDKYLSKISLLSFLKHAAHRPKIVLGLDQSTSKEEAINHFSNWNIPIDFYTPPEVASWHKARGNESMACFCMEHVFGFKLALNLMLASENNVFYADSDVLWFGDFYQSFQCSDSYPIMASIDSGERPFDQPFMAKMAYSLGFDFEKRPHGCAGVCYFRCGSQAFKQVNPFVEMLQSIGGVNRLSEQTIISGLAKRNESFISERIITMDRKITNGFYSGSPTKSLGRHYPAAMRTQFWIDAFHQIYFNK